jgi:2-polyprenyl-3-methyl-5-hydroxy-6-metoxy-1,4-benzoquinol methylase
MSSAQPVASPSPAPIFDTLTAFQKSAALKGAIDLDLFSAIAEGNTKVPSLAARIGASERGTRILCDYLAIDGFLEKSDHQYRLSPLSAAFLDRRSPAYLGTTASFLSQLHNRHYFDDMAKVVQTGHSAMEAGTVGHEDPIWIDFAHSMAPMMVMPAQAIATLLGAGSGEHWKVLDIAAGHGLFGIAMAEQNPKAEVWAQDWATVLEVATANAARHGVLERLHTIPGSAFEVDFGSGYDIVLLTNFLHHFDPPTCEALLAKVKVALKPDGRVATLEFVPNDDRVTPPMAAQFAMVMLATTPSGDAYTFAELDGMFRRAGFARSERFTIPPTEQTLLVSHLR